MMKQSNIKNVMNKTSVSHFAAALTLMVSVNAVADTNWQCDIRQGATSSGESGFEPCWSVGAGLGISYMNPDENNSSWKVGSDTDSSWLTYVNYHFKPNWFAELTYLDLGEVAAKDRNTVRNLNGNISYEVPALMVGYYFDLHEVSNNKVPKLPINPFLKFGVSAIDNSSSPSTIPFEEKNGTQLALGVGFDWRFHKNWTLRNQFQSFDIDAMSYNVSVAYIFGGSKKTSPSTEAAVEPVKINEPVAPPVATVAAPVEAAPPAEPQVSEATCKLFEGSLEGINFENGSADLTAEAKQGLTNAVTALTEYADLNIEIHAHTDWKGKGPANQILSQQRAQSVVDYFVSQGINADRLTPKGFGEMEPIADNNTAEGRAQNRRVELKLLEQGSCQ
jgi:outer membrane protein OmpA-like peptidoglycan-associated protein